MVSYTIAVTQAIWRRPLSSLNGLLQKRIRLEGELPHQPETLAALVAPICVDMLAQLSYPGAPQLKGEAVEALLEYMYKRALEIGVSLDTPLSAKGFRLGYAEGLLAHPRHPVQVQGYVGLFTWLVVQYDDIVGQSNQMVEEALLFNERLLRGEPQPNNLLEGIAGLLREAHDHFDPVLANMLQISVLKFLTRHRFPDFYRDMSGMDQAYAVFCYPKAQYPDVGAFLEAMPDMANFINISNDVLSFYKEELGGDKRNYVHNRATCTEKPVLTVVAEVSQETLASAKRVEQILKGRGIYERSWQESVRGYIAMHTTNPRYRLTDLGIGEEHPLAPFEHRIGQLFEEMGKME
ncbi:longiborneol synthase [Fusarium mexicanum]|uniref:Longiborneol synthase n=1 Tax=Fusarium mexicanum TaxID=751941 RepID=A0A8H5IP64_9HYPO|nr:longiborneol synthase [Fusarium mexicanum]